MPEEAPKYFALLTEAGQALEARALALGKGIEITHVAVGDANREYIAPKASATALAREVWRGQIASKAVSASDPNITELRAIIPAKDGGFWIRELGVIAHLEGETEEVLYAYANHAPYYKMLPQDGQNVTHEVIIPITTSSNAKVTIVVSDQGYATKSELDDLRRELAGSRERDLALVELARNTLALQNRVTKIELARIEGASLPPDSLQTRMPPEGYQLGDAVIAPVTLVPDGVDAPAGAACVVKLEDFQPTNQ